MKKSFRDKLDKMVSVQKSHGDKSGFGFDGNFFFLSKNCEEICWHWFFYIDLAL